MRTNLNTLARELCRAEGGAEQVNIAQVKDLLARLGDRWQAVSRAQALAEFAALINVAESKLRP